MADYQGFAYADGARIEVHDRVLIRSRGRIVGMILRRHPRKRTVLVRYETGALHRRTGKPVLKAEQFSVNEIELVTRDV